MIPPAPSYVVLAITETHTMDCSRFEELVSDYLDCGMARPDRRDFCEHLLACRPCHLLFNDVREAIDGCREWKESQMSEVAMGTDFERRIIDATTAGEMLSCRTLDALISDYFDGLIEGEYETVFSEHFAACEGCRRLVEGLRESLEEQESVEAPEELYGRIFAATSRAAGGSRR
jgi:predicted anti-sigma-YlaC factor YlaD